MKRCNRCNKEKEFIEFGIDKARKDGLNYGCKLCLREYRLAYKKANPEYAKNYADNYREKNREALRKKAALTFHRDKEKRLEQGKKSYYKNRDKISKSRKVKRMLPGALEKERERQAKYRRRDPKKSRSYVKKWQQTNKEKHCAHQRVHRAVEDGSLIRSKSCEECGMICKTEGHHEDYSKPLKVIWLCRKCHGKKIETVEV